MNFGFPDSMPRCIGNVLVLHPFSMYFCSPFTQNSVFIHVLLPACWKGPSLCSEKPALENQLAVLCHSAFWGSFTCDAANQGLEDAKICFSEVQDYNSTVNLPSLKLCGFRVTADHILRRLWYEILIIRLTVAESYSCESITDNVN